MNAGGSKTAAHHFPRHVAAKSTSKQAIRTINPTSSTVSDGIGHFLGLRSNIFSPSHTENHSTAGTISNNHHKDISTPSLLWSDRTTKQAGFQNSRFVLPDGTTAAIAPQPPSLAAVTISKFTGGPNLGEAAAAISVTSREVAAAPILAVTFMRIA